MEQHSIRGNNWDGEEEEKVIDLRNIINKSLAIWPWMLLGAVVMGILSLTYLYFATPSYKVNAKILIKDDDKKGPGGSMPDKSMLQSIGLLTGASNVDNELEIINSYSLMNNVVTDLQLNVTTYTSRKFKTVELYDKENPFIVRFLSFNDSALAFGGLSYKFSTGDHDQSITINSVDEKEKQYIEKFGDTLILPAGKMTLNANPEFKGRRGGDYKIVVNDITTITLKTQKELNATIPNKQVSTIAITLPVTIPSKGEKIINTLIKEYMQANVDDNNRIADSTMSFIDGRLLVVGDQLTDIEKQIQGFKQQNNLADLTEQSKALIDNTSAYAQKQAEQEVILNVIESLERYLKENENNPRVVPASLLVQDPTLTAVITQYNGLLMQRSRLLLATTETNPMVQNLDGQISDLKSDLVHAMSSVKRSTQVALNTVKGGAGRLEAQIKQVPAKERVFLDYSRQQQIRQELYLFLLQKREETAISRSSTMANARIIDAAKADEKPFEPKKAIIFLIALVLGVIIPFGIIYLRDLFNTKIKTKEDIERETKVAILGEIGHNDDGNFITVTQKSRSLVAEQFRALRANLQFLFTNKDEKVIMMTSSMSGEGKSFIATNLAMVFALANKKVVLLELDLRKPKIMSSLDLKFDKGFSQYAIGAATLDQIIYPSGVHENLFIIPAGPIPPNPSELILHERTAAMFAALKEQFDYIIVDTTPNLVSDAQLLSVHADATLYVARLEYTRKEQLHIPDRLSKQGKLPKLNLVINDIKPKRNGSGYYGYGYGGYGYGGYGYGYGYGEYIEGASSKKTKGKKA
jgi:capsular exopolysaccharide synthesis family protein